MKKSMYLPLVIMSLVSFNAAAQFSASIKPTMCHFDSGEVLSASCYDLAPVSDGCPKGFLPDGDICFREDVDTEPSEVLRQSCPDDMVLMGSKCVLEEPNEDLQEE